MGDRMGLRHPPMAFTERGVAMLSSVLNSERAILVNIEIMRAFVQLRRMLASNTELARRLDALEKRYDAQFKVVFDATLGDAINLFTRHLCKNAGFGTSGCRGGT
jgi:hypothetical protein